MNLWIATTLSIVAPPLPPPLLKGGLDLPKIEPLGGGYKIFC